MLNIDLFKECNITLHKQPTPDIYTGSILETFIGGSVGS